MVNQIIHHLKLTTTKRLLYILFFAASLVWQGATAQAPYIITTIAGNGTSSYTGTDMPATAVGFNGPEGLVIDGSGNIYIADTYNQRVRVVNTSGIINLIAGNGLTGNTGDGGPATTAEFYDPRGLLFDGAGNLYIADDDNDKVRKVSGGIITTVAGTGSLSCCSGGYGGEGGPATAAQMGYIRDIAFDALGNLFIDDLSFERILKVNTAGIINTVAGGAPLPLGDGGPATLAHLMSPISIALDSAGDLYIADQTENRIRRVNAAGIITTVAGTGTASYTGDNGPATTATLNSPSGVAVDGAGNIYISDLMNNVIRMVNTAGIITTIAGTGMEGYSGDGCAATAAGLYAPFGIKVFGGDVYFCDEENNRVRKLSRDAAPHFINGHSQAATWCAGTDSINALLAVMDSDANQAETWSVVSGPAHGTLTASCTTTSTGGILTPTGLYYTSAAGYAGPDSFTVSVTDCAGMSDTTTIHATVITTITAVTAGAPGFVCAGATSSLTPSLYGGTWSSAGTAVATVGSASGVVSGVAAGTAIISYTLSLSCGSAATAVTVMVNGSPPAISGTVPIAIGMCAGATTLLSDAISGGAWSSGATAVATIGSAGTVYAVAAGTATVSYTIADGCSTLLPVTVNALPAAITGALNVCAGLTTTLGDAASGGTWSSTGSAIATVSSATGTVAGISTGTATITYTIADGCSATAQVTVLATPAAITGANNVCAGTTITLAESGTGGSWSSGSISLATTGSTGIITGVAAGAATVSYTLTDGCSAILPLTVTPLPQAITGAAMLCAGSSAALSDTGSGTWSSGNTIVATMGSTGAVYGVAAGTSMITYTAVTGCTAAGAVTVNALPAPPIAIGTGTTAICSGAATTLHDVTTGGVWSSGNTAIAAVGSLSGIVTGSSVSTTGTATITYTGANSCAISAVVTVNPLPAAITGAASLCAGATTILSVGSTGSLSVGAWSSSNTTIATVGTSGILSGVAGGRATIYYTLPTGCNTSAVITVLPSPSVPIAIGTGVLSTCIGATTTLSDLITGGYWTSSNTAVATIDPILGIVTGAATGTATISYTLGTGCAIAATVTINNAPLPVSGTLTLCPGSTTGLSDGISGGSWSGGSTGIATVSSAGSPATGIVYGVGAGIAIISYSVGTCAVTAIVTVNASPPAISGVTEVCVGLGTSLSNVTTGGVWSSSNASVASIVGTTGILTGGGAGTATISYTLPDGCATTRTETVNTTPPVIAGVMIVCPGATTLLIDGGGGSWSSGNTAAATVSVSGGAGAEVVTGASVGTASINYSIGAGCATSIVVTVNPLPAAISGTTVLCAGATTILSDPASGGTGGAGTWSSGSTGTATVSASGGAVSGVEGGTAVITYTAATTGCTARATVTVNAQPAGITGTLAVCQGATTLLSDHTTGGVWSSGATATATVSAGAGTVSGVAAGTAVIVYANPATGCATHATVTVNPLPLSVTGTFTICAGASTTLLDGTSGGTWSAATGSIATIGSVSGVVNGVSGGAEVVSYTLPTGCVQTTTLMVNAIPTIAGPTAECAGAVIGEVVAPTGGTWSSSVSTVATVGSLGSVTGVATGTTVITYTSLPGCKATTTITVSLSPGVIIGAVPIAIGMCAGDTTVLSDAVGGGVWSSSNSGAATVGSLSGTVMGVAAGTTVITYSLGSTGCTVTRILTVNAAPAGITGTTGMCAGATTMLADVTIGGVWISSGSGIATVNSLGDVTGVANGATAITYTHGGCSVSIIVTVNLTPLPVTGAGSVCAGDSIALGDGIGGGLWTSSNTGVATVDAGGYATGLSLGIAAITYSLGAGCTVTKIITVNPISAITGSMGMCLGTTSTLSDAATGGAWSSGASSTASVNSIGIITGALAGTSVIIYTTMAGCTATAVITINLAPSAISGVLHLCAGAATSLGNTAGGGLWTSSNTTVATIGSTGIVTGIIPGTAIITYSLGSGCTVTAMVTVDAVPSGITGTMSMCVGATAELGDASTGGAWSLAVGGVATVSGTGIVSGVSAGTVAVSYEFASGCGATALVTVNPIPAAITGTTGICAGLTAALSSATTGGAWSSSSAIVASVDPVLGIVTGVAPGTAVIIYAFPSGCSTATTVTINAAPVAMSGSMAVCMGSTTTLSDPSAGGAWSSGNTGVALVSAGTVNGIGLGTATISYTVGGCPATAIVTVNSLPDAISGTSVCVGSTETLADLPDGGTWSSGNVGVATIDETEGIVTGMLAGTATIAYSLGAGCTVTASVTVEALPGAVTGTPEVCVGYTTSLTDVAGGGVWSSANTSTAIVSAGVGGAGAVTGVSGGAATISYTSRATGCAATRLVTVVALPAISGVSDMCAFSSVATVSDAITGGTWTSTSVTVSTAGVVTPYSAGAASLTYTIPLGCYVTASFIVHPLPGPVTGISRFCRGSTVTLGDTTGGGVWSSGNSAVAVVSAGAVMGLSAGTSVISYVLASGCMETVAITVDSFPVAGTITGLTSVCVGATVTLSVVSASTLLTGSLWSSSNTSADVSGGIVSGLSAGVDTIKYTVNNSCGSAAATKTVVINPLPDAGAISGLAVVCVDGSIVLSDAIPGGVWSSSSTATVAGGVVRGVTTGTDTIRYSVTNSCGTAAAVKIVTVNTVPDAGSISLLDTLCTGFTYMLTDSIPGGVWSSSNSSSLSISVTGLISALSAGVDTISYSLTNMCGATSASATIAVKAVSAPDTITGLAYVCVGGADTLIATPLGGVWGSSNANVAVTPTAAGAIISGILPGADTITYAMPGECSGAGGIYPITVLSLNQCGEGTSPQPSPKEGEVLRVWPNPNDGTFSVLLPANTDELVQLTVTNIVGEKVTELTTVTNKATAIYLRDADGVYFISASTAQGSFEAKAVIAK